jgi:hypothetical protein
MKPPHRSLSEALKPAALPPEALAIISEGSPKPLTQNSTVAVDSVRVEPTALPKQIEEIQRPAKPKAEKLREIETNALVSTNFRVPANIPSALLKASSDRKIKKIQPFTQQDIVAEALTAWLQKNGYQI